tara:strand:+ start:1251 stop:2315 length:1065 start_codon:yes stop_codon:yes gene_type:complete
MRFLAPIVFTTCILLANFLSAQANENFDAYLEAEDRNLISEGGRYFEVIDDMILELEGEGVLSVQIKDIQKWPNGVVPISFANNYPESQRQIFFEACNWWAEASSVSCVPRTNQMNYIHVNPSMTVNNSYVGMIGGQQVLNLASRFNHGIIAHEIAHALGFTHQHNAPNRDQFVNIQWDNLVEGVAHNFRVVDNAIVFGDYDFCSILHYGQTAFSRNGSNTIDIIGNLPNCRIGQRDYLSNSDKLGMAGAYGQDADDERISIVPDFVNKFSSPDDFTNSNAYTRFGVRTQIISGDVKRGCRWQTICERVCYETSAIWQSPAAGERVPFGVVVSLKTHTSSKFHLADPPRGQICP